MAVYQTFNSKIRQCLQKEPLEKVMVFFDRDRTEKIITVRDWQSKVALTQQILIEKQIKPKDLVLIALPHSLELVFGFWALMSIGAIPSIFPYRFALSNHDNYLHNLVELIQRSNAKAVITTPDLVNELSKLIVNISSEAITKSGVQSTIAKGGLLRKITKSGVQSTIAKGGLLRKITKSGVQSTIAAKSTPNLSENPNVRLISLILPEKSLDLNDSDVSIFSEEKTEEEDVAYIQYTSGTTGSKKGVLLSKRAINNFSQSFAQALAINQKDVIVNWLPLYHDFGLFAGLVMPMLIGIPTVLMSPLKWVRSPKSFLWAIHKYSGTICWTTNFGYHHCVKNTSEKNLKGLNLSTLRVMGCGAEPIRYESQQLFLHKFSPYGFKEEAFVTGYGMAENTLTVTVSESGKRAKVEWIDPKSIQEVGYVIKKSPTEKGSKPIVSCGSPLSQTDVLIIDEENNSLPEGYLGEIIIRSSSLFNGYYNEPELTAKTLKDGWFYSGDMGYLADGELYICGRKKDLIIIDGKNIYPEDLEAIANQMSEIVTGNSVAFGIKDNQLGTEKVVMICDLERFISEEEKPQIQLKLRRAIYEKLGINLSELHLVKKGWVIKTANGKMSRASNREKYQLQLVQGKSKT